MIVRSSNENFKDYWDCLYSRTNNISPLYSRKCQDFYAQRPYDEGKTIIDKSFMGLAAKDQSDVDLRNLVISNSDIGLASYIKKNEYNSSTVNINKLSTNNNSREFFFEEGSKVKIDGKDNKNFEINVFEKIYPPKELNQKNIAGFVYGLKSQLI